MHEEPNNVSLQRLYDFWKSIALILIGMTLSWIIFWTTGARTFVTRADVDSMIVTHTEITKADNEIVRERIRNLTDQIGLLQQKLDKLSNRLGVDDTDVVVKKYKE